MPQSKLPIVRIGRLCENMGRGKCLIKLTTLLGLTIFQAGTFAADTRMHDQLRNEENWQKQLLIKDVRSSIDTYYRFLDSHAHCESGVAWKKTLDDICASPKVSLSDAADAAGKEWQEEIKREVAAEFAKKPLKENVHESCMKELPAQDERRRVAKELDAGRSQPGGAAQAAALAKADFKQEHFMNEAGVLCYSDLRSPSKDDESLRSHVAKNYATTAAGRKILEALCSGMYKFHSSADPGLIRYVQDELDRGWNAKVPPAQRVTAGAFKSFNEAAALLSYNLVLAAYEDRSYERLELEPLIKDLDSSFWLNTARELRPKECASPLPGSHECACHGAAFNRENIFRGLRKKEALLSKVLSKTQGMFQEMLDDSALSDTVKKSFRETAPKYLTPPENRHAQRSRNMADIELDIYGGYNAAWSHEMGKFFMTIGTAKLIEDPKYETSIESTMMHEWGHFLRTFNSKRTQDYCRRQPHLCPETTMVKWAASDQKVIDKLMACIDENVRRGEFATFALEGRMSAPPTEQQISRKRSEYFADLFYKRYWRKKADPQQFKTALSLYCDHGNERHDEEQARAEMHDSHAAHRYRIYSVAHGIIPLEGDSLNIEEPKDCEKILWPAD